MSIIGKRFGRLIVTGREFGDRYRCLCDCGKLHSVCQSALSRGTRSCGCLRRDMMRAKATRHGLADTPIYAVWRTLIQRCTNPNNKDYLDYGGRGITVCDEWRSDFAAFLRDMGERPEGKLTIERKDNSKGYEPGNCYWGTWSEQAFNRRPKGQGRKARGL